MPKSVYDRIDSFIAYFQNQVESIRSIEVEGNHGHIYHRILYISVIDALSKVVFPRRKNRERFVNFLSDFSEWDNANRISLPHLVKLLRLVPDPDFEELRSHAFSLLDQWAKGDIITLDRDPLIGEIGRFWPKDSSLRLPLNNISLESLQHKHLFYNHRNALIHEFRFLGLLSGHPGMMADAPYYALLFVSDHIVVGTRESWELQYPVIFYEQVTQNCIYRLKDYLYRNQIDPLIFYSEGSYWIDSLN